MSQLVAFASRLPVFDRDGVPVEVGARVEVKRCVGRYGQTVTEQGVVIQQSEKDPVGASYGQFMYRTDAGKTEWAGVEYRNSKAVCFLNWDDFEHGHEQWVRVIA